MAHRTKRYYIRAVCEVEFCVEFDEELSQYEAREQFIEGDFMEVKLEPEIGDKYVVTMATPDLSENCDE